MADPAADAAALRAAAEVIRRTSPRSTFALRIVLRVLELRATRLEAAADAARQAP